MDLSKPQDVITNITSKCIISIGDRHSQNLNRRGNTTTQALNLPVFYNIFESVYQKGPLSEY
ncbi:MAG TPA: hypothetical protein VJ799_09335 [Nitrososphaeraceae archaeon]|nr:hypothetical protein [Nitrososphaeraceae archaeon]